MVIGLIVLAILVAVRLMSVFRFVKGPSMLPTLRSGDLLLAVRTVPGLRPRVGQVLIVARRGHDLVKRLVRTLPDGRLWIVGDNQHVSTDSRRFGPVPRSALRGTVIAVVWPRSRWRWVRRTVAAGPPGVLMASAERGG